MATTSSANHDAETGSAGPRIKQSAIQFDQRNTAMPDFLFESARRIVCRQGASQELAPLLHELGVTHALIVTDPGLTKAGLTAAPLAALKAAGLRISIFSEVLADPPEESIEAAVAMARTAGVDGVVGLGGGSSLDTAKLVAALAPTTQSLSDIYGVERIKGRGLPLVQVPTTAGTGSEVTPIAVVTTPGNEKKGVVSHALYPDVAVLDCLLTLGLPAAATAMTGIDAMVHAIEAYTTRHRKNAISDALAVKALQLLFANLTRAVEDGSDVQARESMLQGALLAGMAFANAPVAAVHALAAPLGGHFHAPHGLTNALVLLPVLRFNLPTARGLYAELGRAIVPEYGNAPDGEAADALIQALHSLVSAMPFAQRLSDIGVTAQDLPMLARDAMKQDRLLANNPRDVLYEDAVAIFTEAL